MTEGIKRRHTRAQNRSCLFRLDDVWNRCQALRRGEHVLGISAIVADSRYLQTIAVYEIAAAARLAESAVSPVPADANSLTDLLGPCMRPEAMNRSGDLMSRHARVLDAPGQWPSFVKESLWHKPHASTRKSTCPGPGSGIGRSTISIGPPRRDT